VADSHFPFRKLNISLSSCAFYTRAEKKNARPARSSIYLLALDLSRGWCWLRGDFHQAKNTTTLELFSNAHLPERGKFDWLEQDAGGRDAGWGIDYLRVSLSALRPEITNVINFTHRRATICASGMEIHMRTHAQTNFTVCYIQRNIPGKQGWILNSEQAQRHKDGFINYYPNCRTSFLFTRKITAKTQFRDKGSNTCVTFCHWWIDGPKNEKCICEARFWIES